MGFGLREVDTRGSSLDATFNADGKVISDMSGGHQGAGAPDPAYSVIVQPKFLAMLNS